MTQAQQEARLYLDQDMSQPIVQSLHDGQVAIFSSRSPDKPTGNEDGALALTSSMGYTVLGVADGLGGGPVGERAAKLALTQIQHSVESMQSPEQSIRNAIVDGLEQANKVVMQRGRGSATTLAVVGIQQNNVRAYHVGDSVILHLSNRGKIKYESVSHSPVGYGVEAGFLDSEEALYHESRHLVSNVVGSADMRIEIGPPLNLSHRDTVLIASDGLVDNLTIREIVERVRKGKLSTAIRRLVKDARARMLQVQPGLPSKPDDLTVVLYRPGGSQSRKPDSPAQDVCDQVPTSAADSCPSLIAENARPLGSEAVQADSVVAMSENHEIFDDR